MASFGKDQSHFNNKVFVTIKGIFLNPQSYLNNLPINIVALVLLILTASGQVLIPLNSSRPENPDTEKDWKKSSFAEIRLWQDPFDRIKIEKDSDSITDLQQELDDHKRVNVLAVSIPGSSYTELIEIRRRARFAVVSALDTEKYYPEQPNNIKLYKFHPNLSACGLQDSVKIPYEWFSTDDLSSSILILWLDEDVIKQTENGYANFINCLAKEIDNYWNPRKKASDFPIPFKLIGPSNTDLFIDLLGSEKAQQFQLNASTTSDFFSDLLLEELSGAFKENRFETFIHNATIPVDDVTRRLKSKFCRNGITFENTKKWYCGTNITDEKFNEILVQRKIHRIIGTDDQLATAIFWELYQRGINQTTSEADFKANSKKKPDCPDGVVLITELDTYYARALAEHMKKNSFWDHCNNKIGSIDVRNKNLTEDKDPDKSEISTAHDKKSTYGNELITSFSYFRGIDGKLSSDLTKQVSTKGAEFSFDNKGPLMQWDDAPPDHADGRNQYDYLRRLTETIAALDANEKFAKNGVKAIGVLGSDVYDKLIIFQALREKFTNKILFTTDLDARYLHKDQQKWARNLVVASNFDFKLHHELQGNSMPFRDSYQSSLYYAVWSAICKEDNACKDRARKKDFLNHSGYPIKSNPQIFEIGRTHAIHLDSLSVNYLNDWVKCLDSNIRSEEQKIEKHEERVCIEELLNQYDDQERNKVDSDRIWRKYKHATIEPMRSWEKERIAVITERFLQVSITILAIAFVYYFVLLKWMRLSTTPMIKKDFVALFTVCLSFGFVVLPFSIIEIYQDSDISEPMYWLEGVSVWPNLSIRYFGLIVIVLFFINFFNWLRECNKQNSKNLAIVEGERFWVNYFSDTYQKRMWLGIAVASVFFTVLSFLILAGKTDVFEEALNFPYRGAIVNQLHKWLSVIQMLVLWVLVFWVAFEGIACRKMIEEICLEKQDDTENKIWTTKALQLTESQIGIPQKKLHRFMQFQLIVDHAKCISRLIYLPLGMVFFILVGRSKIFDQFGIPLSLIVILIVAVVYVIVITYQLRLAAEMLRKGLIDQYETERIKPNQDVSQIDRLILLIKQENQGIYASFGHQTALTALLIPFGGMSGVQILEFLFNI